MTTRRKQLSIRQQLKLKRDIRKAWSNAQWEFIRREGRTPTIPELIAERYKEHS